MSSTNSSPARRNGNDRILTIDWKLLWGRARARIGQLFVSLRHKAANTEYIPPAWMQRFRLTWFRIGLMLLALFVFTQKQVDFTVSVGKEGIAMGASEGRHSATKTSGATASKAGMGLLPVSNSAPPTAAAPLTPANWNVNDLDAANVRAYINRFEKVAQGEEVKFNVPAPANMALAILFSQAGQSAAAKRDNNHFNPITQDSYYDNAWSNWRAHSEYLNKRFPELADNSVNYQQWVAALAKTKYSSDSKLATKVMDIVERFNLDRL